MKLCQFENDTCIVCGSARLNARQICPEEPTSPPPPPGPGATLKKLLSRIGITASPGCSCNAHAQEMDAWGIDEASRPERIEQAVGWLREEAQKRGLPFLDVAGRLLIRRAISNARRASREKETGRSAV